MIQCTCLCTCCDIQVFLLPDDATEYIICHSCGRHLRPSRIGAFGETEWLVSDDPNLLIQYPTARLTPRKQRLFVCACCRFIWHLLSDVRSRSAVEVAERYADQLATNDELSRACESARSVIFQTTGYTPATAAMTAASLEPYPKAIITASVGWHRNRRSEDAHRVASFFRDIIGNPFRDLPTMDPSWLRWNGGTIPLLATTIYEERAFDRMPILGDALEEAGCVNADILEHCRQPGEHARGCWVVDAILGKE